MTADLTEILNFFIDIDGFDTRPLGKGHINDTFLIKTNKKQYVLQRINSEVFPEPEKIMQNLYNLSLYFSEKYPDRLFLNPLKSHCGKTFHVDNKGRYWRLFLYIPGTVTIEIAETPEQAFEAGRAFGEFQKQFASYEGEPLYETVKDFHNTPERYKNFEEALKEGIPQRIKEAQEIVDFYRTHKWIAPRLLDLNKRDLIPVRITHNDCKINNLLIDGSSGGSVCVIDLDTVMPGLSLYDLGDLLRTVTSPAAEDEEDLEKVFVRKDMFKSVVSGYLSEADSFLNSVEVENIPFSGVLITYETGLRFLTDYLLGDVYFKVSKENHNLVRAKTQMQLVKCMLNREDEMKQFAKKVFEENEAIY